ncbi:hypothetical protein HBB16_12185 [Pseudonocardia sp. MCCB 268]|nr:hypothetical protein [Pseudonocardia cytotoxica]
MEPKPAATVLLSSATSLKRLPAGVPAVTCAMPRWRSRADDGVPRRRGLARRPGSGFAGD